MATGKITLDEGTTTNTATHTISEDAVTKHIPRSVLNNSSGTEIGTSSNPIEVALRSSTVGVATAAKQPALGTAGTASADVISVQGITSMTPLLVTPSLPSGASTAANQTTIIGHLDGVEGSLTTVAGAVSGTEMQVDVLTMPTVTVTASNLDVQSGGADLATSTQAGAIQTSVELLDDTVFADDAAVTLSTSKGNLIEGVAVQTDGTDPGAVSAEADAAALRTDMNRILLVNQTHPRGTTVSADYASAQTNTSVISAPGASLSIYITDIMLSNGATAGNVTLLDGSGGTVLWEAYPAVNGGAVLNLRTPIRLTANTALCITSTTVTTHSIFIGGYIAP